MQLKIFNDIYSINSFNLKFINPETEARLDQYTADQDEDRSIIAGHILVSLLVLAGIANFFLNSNSYNVYTNISWFILYLIPSVILSALYFFKERAEQNYKYIVYLIIFSGAYTGIHTSVVYAFSDHSYSIVYFLCMLFISLCYYFLLKLKFYYSAFVGVFLAILQIVVLFFYAEAPNDLIANGAAINSEFLNTVIFYAIFHAVFLLGFNIISIYIAYQMGVNLRYSFVTQDQLEIEKNKTQNLLASILPLSITNRLIKTDGLSAEDFIAENYTSATVLFADIVGFTKMSIHMTPDEVIKMLNKIFSRFDALAHKYDVEKIKTIGDAYMAVAGVPAYREDHTDVMAKMAIEMLREIKEVSPELDLRIGLHTGPLVAGVVGTTKFAYDLWGDTVNTASRMESHSVPGKIHVSDEMKLILGEKYTLESRGIMEIKGKGPMQTWFLVG